MLFINYLWEHVKYSMSHAHHSCWHYYVYYLWFLANQPPSSWLLSLASTRGLNNRFSNPTRSWRLLATPRLCGTTTLLGLESTLMFISIKKERSKVLKLSSTCLKRLESSTRWSVRCVGFDRIWRSKMLLDPVIAAFKPASACSKHASLKYPLSNRCHHNCIVTMNMRTGGICLIAVIGFFFPTLIRGRHEDFCCWWNTLGAFFNIQNTTASPLPAGKFVGVPAFLRGPLAFAVSRGRFTSIHAWPVRELY